MTKLRGWGNGRYGNGDGKNVVAAGLLISVVAAGCAVGPDYARPKVLLNTKWSSDARRATDAAIDIAWWKAFHDPTLNRLIEAAYRQNLSLQIAGLRILEARAELGIAVGDQLPQNVDPIASATAVGLSRHGVNIANVDRHYNEYQIGFDALWELDLWGKYRRGVRAAHASYLASVADYDDAITSLTAEVARTYVLIRTFEVLIDQARQNVDVQQDALEIADSRFRNGATSELDVAQATNLLESTRATIPALQIGLKQAENALSTLLGQPTGYVRSMLVNPKGIPTPPKDVAVGVPAQLLRRRPDIRAAELRAIAQCQRIGVAKAELYPSLFLFGSIGTQATSSSGGAGVSSSIKDLFGPGSLVYAAGGSVFWPILGYPRIINRVRVEDARFQQSLVGYVNAVLVAAQEVEDGVAGFLLSQEAVVFAQNAVTSADTSVRLALVQYREGAVDYQRVVDTQRVLLAAQNRLTEAQSSVTTNAIALYKALGGGWEIRQGDSVVRENTRREMKKRTYWGGYLSKPSRPKVHRQQRPATEIVNGGR
jgi:NodT family efflux transporter outer membrane factor (OMF) lipoprotein